VVSASGSKENVTPPSGKSADRGVFLAPIEPSSNPSEGVSGLQVDVKMTGVVARDSGLVVRWNRVFIDRCFAGFVLRETTLAATAFGVGEDAGVGVGGFDRGAGFVEGFDLTVGGVDLSSSRSLTILADLAGEESGLGGRGGDVGWDFGHGSPSCGVRI